jgi:hypothetical protein
MGIVLGKRKGGLAEPKRQADAFEAYFGKNLLRKESGGAEERAEPWQKFGSITITVTNDCQYSCPYCCNASDLRPKGQFFALSESGGLDGQLIASVRSGIHSGTRIELTGGEPTLHPRFLGLVGALCAPGEGGVKPGSLFVLTNGLRFATPAGAREFVAGLKRAAGEGVRVTIGMSVDDHHAGGEFGAEGREGRWPELLARARNLHEAAEGLQVFHVYMVAGSKVQGGEFAQRVARSMGLKRNETRFCPYISFSALSESPATRLPLKGAPLTPEEEKRLEFRAAENYASFLMVLKGGDGNIQIEPDGTASWNPAFRGVKGAPSERGACLREKPLREVLERIARGLTDGEYAARLEEARKAVSGARPMRRERHSGALARAAGTWAGVFSRMLHPDAAAEEMVVISYGR